MAKTVTIRVPLKDEPGKTAEVSGHVVRLWVGPYQEKFLIQKELSGATFLTHYASGQKVGPGLAETKARLSHRLKVTDREAAVQRIADLVTRYGVDTVWARMQSAPVINP